MNLEQKALCSVLVARWIIELENNIAELDLTMPQDLRPMMEKELGKALILAKETLDAIDES